MQVDGEREGEEGDLGSAGSKTGGDNPGPNRSGGRDSDESPNKITKLDRSSIKFAFAVALAVENLVEKKLWARRWVIPVILRGCRKDGTYVHFTQMIPRGEFYENARRMSMGRIQEEQEALRREQASKEGGKVEAPVDPVEKGKKGDADTGKKEKGGKNEGKNSPTS